MNNIYLTRKTGNRSLRQIFIYVFALLMTKIMSVNRKKKMEFFSLKTTTKNTAGGQQLAISYMYDIWAIFGKHIYIYIYLS